jgi:hypothetical protein
VPHFSTHRPHLAAVSSGYTPSDNVNTLSVGKSTRTSPEKVMLPITGVPASAKPGNSEDTSTASMPNE